MRPKTEGVVFSHSAGSLSPNPEGPSTSQSYTLPNINLRTYYPKTQVPFYWVLWGKLMDEAVGFSLAPGFWIRDFRVLGFVWWD